MITQTADATVELVRYSLEAVS